MNKSPCVYIITNQTNRVLYVGVTSNLVKRIHEHKNKSIDGFTKKYNCTKLVYFEIHDDISLAIAREKQIKAGSREKKLQLIEINNPTYTDLYSSIIL